MYPLKLDTTRIEIKYAWLLLLSPAFTEYADVESRRARMPKLNREQLFGYRTALPPIEIQRRVVAEHDCQIAVTEELRQSTLAALAAIEALTSQVLAEVFDDSLP